MKGRASRSYVSSITNEYHLCVCVYPGLFSPSVLLLPVDTKETAEVRVTEESDHGRKFKVYVASVSRFGRWVCDGEEPRDTGKVQHPVFHSLGSQVHFAPKYKAA